MSYFQSTRAFSPQTLGRLADQLANSKRVPMESLDATEVNSVSARIGSGQFFADQQWQDVPQQIQGAQHSVVVNLPDAASVHVWGSGAADAAMNATLWLAWGSQQERFQASVPLDVQAIIGGLPRVPAVQILVEGPTDAAMLSELIDWERLRAENRSAVQEFFGLTDADSSGSKCE